MMIHEQKICFLKGSTKNLFLRMNLDVQYIDIPMFFYVVKKHFPEEAHLNSRAKRRLIIK